MFYPKKSEACRILESMKFLEELLSVDDEEVERVLENFNHKDASEYARKIVSVYGKPREITPTRLVWYNADQFEETVVQDESVPHNFPSPHRDFCYSSITLEVPEQLARTIHHTTGSIIYDGLKKKVTARCGSLFANAITLGFVQDLVAGDIPNNPERAKQTYARRIKGGILPEWYSNELNE